ncbi:MAG: glycosyltransferase family 39 protein [Verrucomicrobiota bacterium]|nr:glycosyltransferase family 39 protein [Verrucomicrobiota bacterium]
MINLRRVFGLRGSAELWAAASIFLLQAFLKIWAVFHFRFDTDESQHLHVIWAWTHGLVQYRDVFDNHMPLFQLLCAPLLALMGEHARDLYWMRLLMLPLYFLSFYFIFRIGALVFSRRVGTWSALGAGCCGGYFFCSTEFRTDNLWALFWLMSIFVLLRGALRWRQALVAGLLLGLAFAVSMKSTLMLVALVAAGAVSLAMLGGRSVFQHRRAIAASAGAFLVAMLTPPLAVIGYFAVNGVWPAMRYCVFLHNLGGPIASNFGWRLLSFSIGLALLLYCVRKFSRAAQSPSGAFRRAFLSTACGMYYASLLCFWRHITRQDFLPFYPLAMLLVIGGLSALSQRWERKTFLRPVLLHFSAPAVAVALTLFLTLLPAVPLKNQARSEIDLVRKVLAVSKPGDVFFDCKGETVFRPRAVYEVFEGLTNERIAAGKISEDVPRACAAAQAGFAAMSGRLPDACRRFVKSNYLPVGHGLRAAGSLLPPPASPEEDAPFSIAIPGEYVVVQANGKAAGTLDGLRYDGARFLAQGMHVFRATTPGERLAVIWAAAAHRRLNPFSLPAA